MFLSHVNVTLSLSLPCKDTVRRKPFESQKVGRGDYRNYYKGHMDKIKGEGGGGGGRWVQLGWGGGMGRKSRLL